MPANIKFKNPPINELVIGVYFNQPTAGLRAEHVGLFWSEVRKDFPGIEQHIEVAPPFNFLGTTINIEFSSEPYPMPRFWLISANQSTVLQIQKNAFIINWRKQNTNYPHFEHVKSLFDNYYVRYADFIHRELKGSLPSILGAELTYSNVIEMGPYWQSLEDTPRVIPGFTVPNPGETAQSFPDFTQVTAYKFAADLGLNVTVSSARVANNRNQPLLTIEIKALGPLGAASREEADVWYIRAHEAIGRCFKAMTNPDIQQDHWQPV